MRGGCCLAQGSADEVGGAGHGAEEHDGEVEHVPEFRAGPLPRPSNHRACADPGRFRVRNNDGNGVLAGNFFGVEG